MKNILVTGSGGFIGKALCARLGSLLFNVTGFDLEQGDISAPTALSVCDEQSINYVYHLAARTFVPHSWTDTAAFYRANVQGTVEVLEFCRKRNAGLCFISSYVYGIPEYLPVDESHPLKPFNPYSHGKIIAEQLCCYYRDQFNLPVTIVRPFNPYGPGQQEHFLIPEIIRQNLDDATPVITVKDTSPRRDYIYISDLVDLLVMMMDQPGKTFNAGSGKSHNAAEIAAIAGSITGNGKQVVTSGQERQNEIPDCYADIRFARSETGWAPRISLEEGIRTMICHARENKG